MDIIIYIILFFIITILFYFYNNKILFIKNIEKFKNNISFIKKKDLLIILLEDKDNYYKKFYKNDFKARNIKTLDEYYKNIAYSVSDADNYIQEKVINAISKADDFFGKVYYDYFDGKICNKITWKIGFIKNKLYESGLPHTRNDIIILNIDTIKYNSIYNLTKTLIHEKVHIYQKKYPNKVNKYILFYNFKKIKKREEYDNIRANPDLDDYIYQDKYNNTYKAFYNKNVLSVEDIIYYPENNQKFEHPFEKMAIEIEKEYK
jgi:hypothetical protein